MYKCKKHWQVHGTKLTLEVGRGIIHYVHPQRSQHLARKIRPSYIKSKQQYSIRAKIWQIFWTYIYNMWGCLRNYFCFKKKSFWNLPLTSTAESVKSVFLFKGFLTISIKMKNIHLLTCKFYFWNLLYRYTLIHVQRNMYRDVRYSTVLREINHRKNVWCNTTQPF